ncbi:MAG TPA: hypothetical protein VHU83_13415 [Bryobacteraceae bacterium]|jgi:hypothetical protein|nr:hypothetical protein [Bryobacteraceae bacterium]
MTDDRKSGIALIAGSLAGVLTLAIHPTGAASLSAGQVAHLSAISAAAHSIAMASILLLFLGGCGLSRRIAAADRLSFAAIVTFGFACVAILIAAAVSGFIIPGIMQHMARDIPAAAHQWQIVIAGVFQINQAFARIFSVAASIAIILWCASGLRNGGLGRGIAIYGCVVAALIILGVGLGHLRLDVHGMAVVGLGQIIWFIPVGIQLCSRPVIAVAPQ